MTMLQRIALILKCARLAGDPRDENVAAAVLAEMRDEPTQAMIRAGMATAGEYAALEVWRDMIDAASTANAP